MSNLRQKILRRRRYRQNIGGGPVTIDTFTQALGAELLANPSFTAWTADDPDGWTVGGEVGSDPMVTQVAPDGSAGTGAARLLATGATNDPVITQAGVMTVGNWYEATGKMTAYTSGNSNSLLIGAIPGQGTQIIMLSVETGYALGKANTTGFSYSGRGTAAHDWVIDDFSLKQIILNPELTSVADGTFEFHFTLPATARRYTSVLFLYRASGDSNFWMAQINATDLTNYGIRLDKVVSGTLTNVAASVNLGSTRPNAVRIVTSGRDHSMYTSTDGGATWVQRSTTKTDSALATQTGVRAIYTSTVTPTKYVLPALF